MSSSAAISAAIAGGALRSAAPASWAINAHIRGLPFRIVAPVSVYLTDHAAEAIVCRDAPFAVPLTHEQGRRLPAIGDSSSATMADRRHGGDAKQVHQVEIPPSATAARSSRPRIDAASPRTASPSSSGRATFVC